MNPIIIGGILGRASFKFGLDFPLFIDQTAEMTIRFKNMINVIATIYVKEGRMSEFIDIFNSNIPNVLNEPGCIEYLPTIDFPRGLTTQQCDENAVTIIEKWRSLDDLKKHFSAPHMLAYRERVKDYVENVSLKILTQA